MNGIIRRAKKFAETIENTTASPFHGGIGISIRPVMNRQGKKRKVDSVGTELESPWRG
ncbi:hypothetical protein BDV28DRAFT_131238, partial [Aspergillus coremiiformis]